MSMISDIADYLVTQGVASQVGSDIWYNYMPDADNVNNAIGVFDTGGLEPDIYLPTKEYTFQVYIRAASYALGKAKLDAVRTALHQLMNTTVGSTYFYFIFAINEGGVVSAGKGEDTRGMVELSINFRTRTR